MPWFGSGRRSAPMIVEREVDRLRLLALPGSALLTELESNGCAPDRRARCARGLRRLYVFAVERLRSPTRSQRSVEFMRLGAARHDLPRHRVNARNDGARAWCGGRIERRDGFTVTRADLTHRPCHCLSWRDSVHAPVHARGAHLRHHRPE